MQMFKRYWKDFAIFWGLFIVFVPQEHNGKFINFATIRNKTRTSYLYV